ncbi:MAG: hypothetical protein HPY79_12295 [Bacteroidales bacterium]|nr:hypothetical protein [Bacteroidales bacterium]
MKRFLLIVFLSTFLFYACKKEKNNYGCIGCYSCEYTNYYLLNTINAISCRNYNELALYDTCISKDFILKLNLEGKKLIESTYDNNPSCIEKKYYINKILKLEIETNLNIKVKNNLLTNGKEIGYSPIELEIDTNSVLYNDTIILLSGTIRIIDLKGNIYSTKVNETYIKF